MKKSILLILLLSTKLVFASTSGTDSLLSNLTLNSYFETYYTYDFGKAQPEKVLGLVNHHKNNEIAINIALIKANYSTERYRANLGVMVGSYANKNYVDLESNFKDDAAIVFKTNTMNEFACSGFSLNYDWRINDDAMFRIEGKIFTNEEPVFLDNNALSNTNQSITTAFILNLNH
jgi:hypothetical protein